MTETTELANTSFFTKIVLFLQNNRFALTALCLLGLLFCGYMLFKGAKNEVKHTTKIQIFKRKVKQQLRQTYIHIMHWVAHIPIVSDLVSNLCHGYKCQEALNEDEAIIRTGKTLFFTLLGFICTFIFGLFWFKDIILSMITGIILAHIVMTSLKANPRKFLSNLNDTIEDFLLTYHKTSGNIDEAFHSVSKTKNPLARHFNIMYEYLRKAYVSDTPEIIQNEYNAICPSRYLRNFYAIVFMTYKYGDNKEEGKSALNINVMEIQEQINDALYQQNKLIDETMGERWFILAPLYALPLLADYMLKYFSFEGFEHIESFLTSSTGYMVQVLCSIITLICYLLYSQMVDRNILEAKINNSWEKKVLKNAHIRKIVMKLLPADSLKRKTLQATINKAGNGESVNVLQIKRVFLASFLFCVAILSSSLNVVTNTFSINNDIYRGLPKENYTQVLMTQDDMYTYIDEMLAADKEVVHYFRDNEEYQLLSDEEQISTITTYLKKNEIDKMYRGYIEYGAQRIHSKINSLERVGGMNNVLFVVLLTLFGYFMPLWLLQLKAFMNKDMLLLDEVSDLQKTTIMLMEYPSTTPDSLLTWYSSSAFMLAPHLRECRVTRDFETLINAVEYKPFIQLATSLEMAFNGLPLKEAFSGVEQRLLTQRKEQARIMENMLKFRIDTVEMFASISMGSVIGLYMFMPLLIAMLQMFLSLDIFSI